MDATDSAQLAKHGLGNNEDVEFRRKGVIIYKVDTTIPGRSGQ